MKIRARVRCSTAKLLLLWVHSAMPFSKLCKNVLREVAQYVPFCESPLCVRGGELLRFEVATQRWRRLHRLRESRLLGAACVGEERVFYEVQTIFATRSRCSAFLLDSTRLSRLPKFSDPRSGYGIIFDQETDSVYLFGGRYLTSSRFEEKSRVSEAISLREKHWRRLPLLGEARCGFTPCWFRRKVYLVGGSCFSVEVYDPVSNVITPVGELTLPDRRDCSALAYPRDGEIHILTQNQMLRWTPGSAPLVSWKYAPELEPRSPPVLCGRWLYVAEAETAYAICLTSSEVRLLPESELAA